MESIHPVPFGPLLALPAGFTEDFQPRRSLLRIAATEFLILVFGFEQWRSDGFWTPLDADGKVSASRETAALAQLDPAFLECAEDAGFRELARRTLIARYFEPNERAELYRLCGLEIPAEDLVSEKSAHRAKRRPWPSSILLFWNARRMPAYDFTCALTRYRMIAIDGSTPLDAAHIQQFKRGGPCEPSNGIALSKTAHWLFDRGFWSITDDYRVVVKSGAFEEAGEASQLLKPHSGRQIMLPNTRGVWPSPVFLGWHRTYHHF